MAKIPDELTDEQVVLLADIASTGFSGAESGGVRIGDRLDGARKVAIKP
jgi:alcohol dehydrogenase